MFRPLLLLPIFAVVSPSYGDVPTSGQIAAAIDTPGVVWSLSSTFENAATIETDPESHQGSKLRFAWVGNIATILEGPFLLTLYGEGPLPTATFNGNSVHPTYQTTANSGRTKSSWAVPAGAGILRINASPGSSMDRVVILDLPADLSTVLELPPDRFETSGDASWSPAPVVTAHAYLAMATVFPGQTPALLETDVQGPAEISFLWRAPGDGLRFFVNDLPVAMDVLDGNISRQFVEIPEGLHRLRWEASSHEHYPLQSFVGRIRIHPLDESNRLNGAFAPPTVLSAISPWIVDGDHQEPDIAGPVISPGIEGFPEPYESSVVPRLTADFEGPGELSFKWRPGANPSHSDAVSWSFVAMDSAISLRSHSRGDWEDHAVWLHPGRQRSVWRANGGRSGLEGSGLAEVVFRPSVPIPLGEAVGAPGLPWESDTEPAWQGLLLGERLGKAAMSPVLAAGGTAGIRTRVTGPGRLTYTVRSMGLQEPLFNLMMAGAERNHGMTLARGTYRIEIPHSWEIPVEWISFHSPDRSELDRPVLGDVIWEPLEERPLAESLDSPPDVSWTTSPEKPFTGRVHDHSYNGSGAFISLARGEETWLEATVSGPGYFDFWVREFFGVDLRYDLWDHFTLTVDGKKVEMADIQWPAILVEGRGTHRIRLTAKNPHGSRFEALAFVVDQVTWESIDYTTFPIGSGLADSSWTSGGGATAYQQTGRDGSPGIAIPSETSGDHWVETEFTGPCEVSWESKIDDLYSGDASHYRIVVGDGPGIDFGFHAWTTMRLTLPEGSHKVRWIVAPTGEPHPLPRLFDPVWAISGFRVKTGLSPLATAVEAPELYALEEGDAGGFPVPIAGGEAWQPGPYARLRLFQPGAEGIATILAGHPSSPPGTWWISSPSVFVAVDSDSPGWREVETPILPGSTPVLSFEPITPEITAPLWDRISLRVGPPEPLAEALDTDLGVTATAWFGAKADHAPVDGDAAWSHLSDSSSVSRLTATVHGPANLTWWWKNEGQGELQLLLDGDLLPMTVPARTWELASVYLGPGEHVVTWRHRGLISVSAAAPAEAWLDGVSVESADEPDHRSTYTSEAMIGSPEDPSPAWPAGGIRNSGQEWIHGIRSKGGEAPFETTVTGPGLLVCRGSSFHDRPGNSAIAPSSVIVVTPGLPSPEILSTFLSIGIDGVEQGRILSGIPGEWQEAVIRIPEGTHTLSFRLRKRSRSFLGVFASDSTDPLHHAWIDDLDMISHADHFATWTAANVLDADWSDPGADPDGDGASNGMEYAFGTSPTDPASRPPGLEIVRATSFRPSDSDLVSRYLRVPFLPAHSEGEVEWSDDLLDWHPLGAEIPRFPPGLSLIDPGDRIPHTDTHFALPLESGGATRFYRLRITGAVGISND